jgi:hypothetical protein
VRKDGAKIDLWLKEIAPSTELRRGFGHDPDRWAEFRRRYRAELKERPNELALLRDRSRHGTVTLLWKGIQTFYAGGPGPLPSLRSPGTTDVDAANARSWVGALAHVEGSPRRASSPRHSC